MSAINDPKRADRGDYESVEALRRKVSEFTAPYATAVMMFEEAAPCALFGRGLPRIQTVSGLNFAKVISSVTSSKTISTGMPPRISLFATATRLPRTLGPSANSISATL